MKNFDMKNIDMHAMKYDLLPNNKEEAFDLIAPVIHALLLAGKPLSCQELYSGLGCGDIPLYLALHSLVEKGFISGPSPYALDCPRNHTEMMYSIEE